MNPVFSIRKVLKDSFNAFVDNFTTLFIRTLQLYVLAFALLVGFIYGIIKTIPFFPLLGSMHNFFNLQVISMLVLFIVAFIVLLNLHMQYQKCMWRALHNQQISGFSYKYFSMNVVLFYMAFLLIVLSGALFLILPGIYLYIRLQVADVAFAIEGCSVEQALRRSWELTRGHFMKMLGIMLIEALLKPLSIVSYPLMAMVHVSAYKQLVDVARRH